MDSFKAEMMDYGLQPPEHIEPGKIHRFPGADKGRSNRAGWCRLFPDGQGGVFGDFSTGLQRTWQAKRNDDFDKAKWLAEKGEFQEQYARAKEARERDHRKAAAKAVFLWNQAQSTASHDYLTRKGIGTHGARIDRHGNLVIPVLVGGKISSLQFIQPDGNKRFLSGGQIAGGWFRLGEITETILICEGFATAATLHEESGHCVYVAFNAGNLYSVARSVRSHHLKADLCICADNDSNTKGNPGVTMARKAAVTVGARLAIPEFPEGVAGTDFNDLALLKRKEVAA